MNSYEKGLKAEKLALEILKEYEILGTRIKTKHGEIDILGKKNGDFYIFEVKTRKTFQKARECVNLRQLNRCINAFFSYAQDNNIQYEQIYIKVIMIVNSKIEIIDISQLE